MPALTRLREERVIDGWGMGVNCPQPILRCLETVDSDVHLLASQVLARRSRERRRAGVPKGPRFRDELRTGGVLHPQAFTPS